VIPLHDILALALNDLDEVETARVEEHVLSCTECASQLERVLAIADRLEKLVRSARIRATPVLPSAIAKLQDAGLITRTYAMSPGESVLCTVDAEDLYVLSQLRADLSGVERIDIVSVIPGQDQRRISDVAFAPNAGQVSYVQSGEVMRPLPSARILVKLVAVSSDRDRVLGEYTFQHTAFTPK
jgi:hypothetical protein